MHNDDGKMEVEDETISHFVKLFVLVLSSIAYYCIFLSKRHSSLFGQPCYTPRFRLQLKKFWAFFTICRYKWSASEERLPTTLTLVPDCRAMEIEKRSSIIGSKSEILRVLAFDQKGNSIGFSFSFYSTWGEVTLQLKLSDGTSFIHATSPTSLIVNPTTQNNEWEGGGLKFEILEPLKRFRVTFNGLLQSNKSTHHVRLNFIWSGCGKVVDVRKDWNAFLMSEALAREPWKQNEWYHVIKDQGSGFDQWGSMRGEVSIDSEKPIDLNLPSLRQRRWGTAEAKSLDRRLGLTGFTKNGTMFYVRATSSPIGLTYSKFGHVRFSDDSQASMSKIDIGLQNLSNNPDSELPRNILISFTAKGKNFQVFSTLERAEARVLGENFVARLTPLMMSINNECGRGVAEFWYRDEEVKLEKPEWKYQDEVSDELPSDAFVIDLNSSLSKIVNFTGGKGSSLAHLTLLSNEKFQVPRGFCVTVNALEKQLKENETLLSQLKLLTDISHTCTKLECENFVSIIRSTPICKEVASEILQHLDILQNVSLAVRSSGVEEDSDDLSAAGQNSTFLGVKGHENVLRAIQECWASAYTFKSIQYRRQHARPVKCNIAVVVQEMVPAAKAGVLFTRNPITGDPRRILISANYGLGETVVSGEIDPDTIEILKDTKNDLSISSTLVGSKQHQIILSEDGTEKKDVIPEASSVLCLSEAEILRLGKIAVYIEECFQSPRDIEWAIFDDKVYLLQARPITSIGQWTDHELLHEMDSPVVAENDITTLGNTGEVLPGATSVLSQSILVALLNRGSAPDVVKVTHHHCTLDILKTLLVYPEDEISIGNKIAEVAVLGHKIVNPDLHKIAVSRNGVYGKLFQLRELLYLLKRALSIKKVADDTKVLSKQFDFDFEKPETSFDLYRTITNELRMLENVQNQHKITSQNSVLSEVIILSILTEGREELSEENLSDMSILLSGTSDVISANVPETLNKLATMISEHLKAEEFSSIPSSEGLKWLSENDATSSLMFRRFLKSHGHRGIREVITFPTTPRKRLEFLRDFQFSDINS